jgi:hypothetical protein
VPGEAAGLEQVARRVQVHLGAELEVLLGTAGNERGEMEDNVDFRCYQRAREGRIRQIADEPGATLVSSDHLVRGEGANQGGTDVARRAGDEYSHRRSYSK